MRRNLVLTLITALTLVFGIAFLTVPSFGVFRAAQRSSYVEFYGRHDEIVASIRTDFSRRRMQWVGLERIAPHLQSLLLQVEDRRFYWHVGVDPVATLRSVTRNIGGHREGASTITMQLVRVMKKEQYNRLPRGILRKIWQSVAAVMIELRWSKKEILEAYLNLVTFKGEVQGVASASEVFFGKGPSGLLIDEAYVLVAMLNQPRQSLEKTQDRVCRIFVKQRPFEACKVDVGVVLGLASERRREGHITSSQTDLAPHLARFTLSSSSESLKKLNKVRVSLDEKLQRDVTALVASHVSTLVARNLNDAAVVILDNQTGEVLSYVSYTSKPELYSEVDGVQAKRQAGSTLKPFLYELALSRKILTSASMLDDRRSFFRSEGRVYAPENSDRQFYGPIPVRFALGNSLNIPAVRTLELVGVESFIQRLKDVGISFSQRDDFYGQSLALGAIDLSLWDLVNGYRTLARGGLFSHPLVQPISSKANVEVQVLDPKSSYIVTDMLSDPRAREITFGLDNILATSFFSAVKTGTSKDMRDNWCVGFSERFTVGVWAGNFDGSPMVNVTGVSGAGPIWSDVMGLLHAKTSSNRPAVPEGVVRSKISAKVGSHSRSWDEFFIAGTEPRGVLLSSANVDVEVQQPFEFVYPMEGLTIAEDGDLPLTQQRIVIQSSDGNREVSYLLNGEMLQGSLIYLSQLKPGLNKLVAVSNSQMHLQEVSFRYVPLAKRRDLKAM